MTNQCRSLLALAMLVGVSGCKDNAAPPKANATTIACFVVSQDRCKEHPLANARWYKAADAAYQQDFCVNTAKGAWSTTF